MGEDSSGPLLQARPDKRRHCQRVLTGIDELLDVGAEIIDQRILPGGVIQVGEGACDIMIGCRVGLQQRLETFLGEASAVILDERRGNGGRHGQVIIRQHAIPFRLQGIGHHARTGEQIQHRVAVESANHFQDMRQDLFFEPIKRVGGIFALVQAKYMVFQPGTRRSCS